jgi:excinuclease ABC subunit A
VTRSELAAQCRPEDVVKEPRSYTGAFLQGLLERRPTGEKAAAE